jgi:hypothetical protein
MGEKTRKRKVSHWCDVVRVKGEDVLVCLRIQ